MKNAPLLSGTGAFFIDLSFPCKRIHGASSHNKSINLIINKLNGKS